MTTRLSSCARQRLARAASTLVVCGGLPLVAWTIVAQGSDPIVTPLASVCSAADPAPHATWTGAAALDAPYSSDDDGDDDVPASGVAIASDVHRASADRVRAELIEVSIEAWISRTPEGVSLRGPPTLQDDDDNLDDNDDDDDGDDSDQLKAVRAAASITDAGCRAESVASHVPARTTSSPTLGHALRAPPERAL